MFGVCATALLTIMRSHLTRYKSPIPLIPFLYQVYLLIPVGALKLIHLQSNLECEANGKAEQREAQAFEAIVIAINNQRYDDDQWNCK